MKSIELFRFMFLLTLGLLAACGKAELNAQNAVTAQSAQAPAAAASSLSTPAEVAATVQARLPDDIVAFQKRRDACDHFRGEEPYNAERGAFLAAEVVRTCAGTDRVLAELRKRYSNDAKAMAALKDYEDKIE